MIATKFDKFEPEWLQDDIYMSHPGTRHPCGICFLDHNGKYCRPCWCNLLISYHSDEDIHCSIETLYGSGSHGKLHEPSNLADDKLHQTPVIQDADHRAEVDHDGENLKWVKNILF